MTAPMTDEKKETPSKVESLLKKKNETLTRDELLKKLKFMESIVEAKERTIRGQNFTIQTITAQNLAMRDLLEQVKAFKPSLFNGGKFERLKECIAAKLDEMRGRGK